MKDLLGRILVVWEGLAPREQVLVGIAGGGLALVLIFFAIVSPIRGAAENARESAALAERELMMMQRMMREWDGLHGRLDQVETRIRGDRQSQNLLTLLESLAARAGVKPTSMEKRQSGESAVYEETKVEVSLKNVTLQQAVGYLASIEGSSQPLSVKSLRIKRRPARGSAAAGGASDLLDVTFSVSTFEPI